MRKYRVDQVVNGKIYQGGKLFSDFQAAKRLAKEQLQADRFTCEYRTSYIVTSVKEA